MVYACVLFYSVTHGVYLVYLYTNVGPINIGRYKPKTYKRRAVQTSDKYKRRTITNIGLLQTSDQYKRQTSANVKQVQTSDQYKVKKLFPFIEWSNKNLP